MGSIRALSLRRECDVASGIGSKEQQEQRTLKTAFVGAAAALSELRTKHIQIVARYIAMPLKKKTLVWVDAEPDSSHSVAVRAGG